METQINEEQEFYKSMSKYIKKCNHSEEWSGFCSNCFMRFMGEEMDRDTGVRLAEGVINEAC